MSRSVAGQGLSREEVASADLRLRLAPLARRLAWAVDDASQHGRLLAAEQPGTVTQRHARALLARIDGAVTRPPDPGPSPQPDPDETALLARLVADAAAVGVEPPCRTLLSCGLDEVDLGVLLVTAAPILEPAFGGLYAYLQDSFDATAPGERLVVRLLSTGADDERRVTEAVGPFGLLRSRGLVETTSADRWAGALMRPGPGVAELLHGSTVDFGLLGLSPDRPAPGSLPAGVDPREIAVLASALAAGTVDVIGLWGAGRHSGDCLVEALCEAACRAAGHERPPVRVAAADAAAGLQRAALAGVPCVVDVPAHDGPDLSDAATLTDLLVRSSTPCVVLSAQPLPFPSLWGVRRVAEVQVATPSGADKEAVWAAAFPALAGDRVAELAGRFALTGDQVRAVAAQDRTAGVWANGHRPAIDQLAARISRPRSPTLAALVTPRRGRDLLVLPPGVEGRVVRVAEDFRAWPTVSEAWRLDRFGGRGVTALFAGPPGTGKTLAAEVIAGEVGLDLMVVDLSLLVSKWIGQTEKNLDAVFTEAAASHCVLFFDEADTVFGRRGEITRGTDRYANLEVGYLLQRLERYDGLVVLATNVSEQLDDAFTRRFHHVVHFARPGPAERRRLWQLVLSPPVVVDGPVDLEALTDVELTGAGVASVVRSAALAAYHEGRGALTMGDLVRGVTRTLQREGRLVPRDLADAYAAELGGGR